MAITRASSMRITPKRRSIESRTHKNQLTSSDSNDQMQANFIAARSNRRRYAVPSTATAEPVVRPATGPSFECHRPISEVTRTICSDRQLAALDRRLSVRFSLLDRSVDLTTIQALHHGETTFLNARLSCADKACLLDIYRQRLRELDNIEPERHVR